MFGIHYKTYQNQKNMIKNNNIKCWSNMSHQERKDAIDNGYNIKLGRMSSKSIMNINTFHDLTIYILYNSIIDKHTKGKV